MATVELITKSDLEKLKLELLTDLKNLIDNIRPPSHHLNVYKSKDVKRILKCSDSTLQYLRDSGKLTCKKIGGIYYYEEQELKNFLSQ